MTLKNFIKNVFKDPLNKLLIILLGLWLILLLFDEVKGAEDNNIYIYPKRDAFCHAVRNPDCYTYINARPYACGFIA